MSRVKIIRGTILTNADCSCGEARSSFDEGSIMKWANGHDTAGGSPDNHIVAITQTAEVSDELLQN